MVIDVSKADARSEWPFIIIIIIIIIKAVVRLYINAKCWVGGACVGPYSHAWWSACRVVWGGMAKRRVVVWWCTAMPT